MELIIAAVVTAIIQALKRLQVKIGSTWTLLVVAALTYIGAIAWNWGQGFITPALLESWGRIASYQFSIWAIVVKFILPQLGLDKQTKK